MGLKRKLGFISILVYVGGMAGGQDIVPREIRDLLDSAHLLYDRVVAREAYELVSPLVRAYEDIYSTCIDFSSGDYAGGFGVWTSANPGDGKHAIGRTWLDLGDCSWRITPLDRDVLPRIVLVDPWGREREIMSADQSTIYWDSSGAESIEPTGLISVDSRFVEIEALMPEEAGDREISVETVVKALRLERVRSNATHEVGPSPWPVWKEATMPSSECFAYANFMLQYVPLDGVDSQVLSRIARIGVKPGKPWPPKGAPANFIEAINAGVEQARASNGKR